MHNSVAPSPHLIASLIRGHAGGSSTSDLLNSPQLLLTWQPQMAAKRRKKSSFPARNRGSDHEFTSRRRAPLNASATFSEAARLSEDFGQATPLPTPVNEANNHQKPSKSHLKSLNRSPTPTSAAASSPGAAPPCVPLHSPRPWGSGRHSPGHLGHRLLQRNLSKTSFLSTSQAVLAHPGLMNQLTFIFFNHLDMIYDYI